jgi:hypothetical protein
MTNFLQATGTNGFIATPYTVLSTELDGLTAAHSGLSSVNGTSGVFSQTDHGHAIEGLPYFVAGGAFTPVAGDFLAGWFIFSPDGGTNFEFTLANADLTRPADFVIPLLATAYSSGKIAPASAKVRLPYSSYKVFLQSHLASVTLPSSGNLLKIGPTANQF